MGGLYIQDFFSYKKKEKENEERKETRGGRTMMVEVSIKKLLEEEKTQVRPEDDGRRLAGRRNAFCFEGMRRGV